ncbi:ATP-grasp fold amidoligase family protein [Jannaschia formosa]|uniref:ATP-grasp fold amidoligase family protein n=1 Tax=Jannaschia formosa TaxID=2259592 RepID=UPI000E1BF2FC|nr:ATP-grasp fold amidoligase family protein [Jannaschia formosa]TFL18856.1 hypothetical protein DR046_08015 [Jannaschia formosa]
MPLSRFTGLPLADRAVLLAAELWIALRAPRLMVNSWRRARAQGFRPFHALPLAGDEKFLWRKVVDRDPLHVTLSDKLAARDWVAAQGLDLPPQPQVLWQGERAEDLPRALLTPDAVVKVNHNSGGVHLVREDGADPELIAQRIAGWLSDDFGRANGEWGYLAIPRRVFVERRVGRPGVPLEDWKVYAFAGRIARVVRIDPQSRPRAGQAYEADETGRLRLLDTPPGVCRVVKKGPPSPRLDEMLHAARALSRSLDHVRVDFLADDRDVWLGELTLYSEGGKFAGKGYDPEAPLSRAWDIRDAGALRRPAGGLAWRIYARSLARALDLADGTRGAGRAGELGP